MFNSIMKLIDGIFNAGKKIYCIHTSCHTIDVKLLLVSDLINVLYINITSIKRKT